MLGELRHFGDLLTRNARLTPGQPGLVLGSERYTWRENAARATRLAGALRGRGLRRGERVAILSENRIAFVEALFALAQSGLAAVPLNTGLVAQEVARILDDCDAAAILTGDETLELARDAAGKVRSVRLLAGLGEGQGEIPAYRELLDEGEERELPLTRPIADDELLALLYTSGTTGFPKGVMYTHRQALWATLIHVLAIGSARRHRVMLPSPLYSAAGFAGIACAVAAGSTVHPVRFDPDVLLSTIVRERITFTNLVPTTLKVLLDHPRFAAHDLGSLEVLLYGGSPMPEETLERAALELRCGFRQTFATSETGLAGTVLEPEDHSRAFEDPENARLLQSCGRPQVGVGVKVLDPQWEEVPDGEVGEIAVACDANMAGYWRRPDTTSKVLQGGWIKTGDMARRDSEGFFYLLDRKHDLILTGALNVYPTEVERVLARHPDVVDCAVVGVPHEKWGEAVTAFVVRKEGSELDKAEVKSFSREELASHKRPKGVYFVDEIPRNPAGKPLRRLLRDTVAPPEAE